MRRALAFTTALVVLSIALLAGRAEAQARDGETLYAQHCAICHEHPTPENKAPPREALATLGPDAILASLTEGNMRIQGQPLSPAERAAVAERVAGRPLTVATTGAVSAPTGQCSDGPLDLRNATSVWNGWGPDVRNTRFQPDAAGISAANVANLKLKWAFGVPNATQSRSQPAVVGGRLFMASQSGMVYALDPVKGCTYWSFRAASGVRTAISVATLGPNGSAAGGGPPAVFFADAQARAYAVDFSTGKQLWVTKVDDHPAARATGAPTYYDGRLYVVLSGVSEETAAAMPDYECCKFRGSLTALDAKTGAVIWKTYTVDEPKLRGKSTTGKPLWGPAGAPIWSAPTIDAKRKLIYAATGNAYADPAPRTSDAIVAFDLATGKIKWVNQIMPDTWILGCAPPPPGAPAGPASDNAALGDNPNCPKDVGPDFDFSASPALVTKRDGSDVLVATQKSGVGYALNPDRRGKVIWQYRWGKGSPVGGVWGATSDGERAYFAVADQLTPAPGGVHAVDLATGQRVWYAPPEPPVCASGPGCSAAQSAALTSIPGVVFAGSADGAVRAYASDTGKILWTFDTNRDFASVNGVKAHGGSIDGPGPVVANGMLYVTAGNAGFVGTPGNVLLAFGLD
ncbi:MAG TPA: PQQ-binding-like beta-propeller repeat protein [Gammaproteobacteria bacterium]|nr:PQQ-binding-like beta-propeller repeat protein [Gammaproteobacteria bacterium]